MQVKVNIMQLNKKFGVEVNRITKYINLSEINISEFSKLTILYILTKKESTDELNISCWPGKAGKITKVNDGIILFLMKKNPSQL